MYVALFRGINVGGKNKISMKSLTGLVEESGYSDVQTYIQSGNMVFQSSGAKAKSFPKTIGKAIESQYGFCPDILIIDGKRLEKAVKANPYPKAEKDPKSLHFYFLETSPKKPNIDKMHELKVASESFEIKGTVLYLHAPDGIGRSKLAAKIESLVGVKASARNFNTVAKLLSLCAK